MYSNQLKFKLNPQEVVKIGMQSFVQENAKIQFQCLFCIHLIFFFFFKK